MREVIAHDWGTINYQDAFEKQDEILQSMIAFKTQNQIFNPNDHLIFCIHPPVYTLGKGGNTKNILITEEEMQKQEIQFFHSNRGGDITFHGPGQIVVYPIFDLEAHKPDIGFYIRNLEEVIIRTLKHFNIQATRSPGDTGVWIDPNIKNKARKICAIGVRCSRWITMHGLALNINTDLDYFNNIIPCGIVDKKVTSLEIEMKHKVDINYVKEIIAQEFKIVFSINIKNKSSYA